MQQKLADDIYELLTHDDQGRVCKDIPDEACSEQPRNFLLHTLSLGATKTGDALVDPKLALSWLLNTLGAPASMIGLLVPIREAGSLLPQLLTAGWIRSLQRRKWVWVGGSVVQGCSVAAMAVAALLLEGIVAAWIILALLAIFAIARSACSVSYKDVLGKTVSKSTRGTATGSAATIAAILAFLFGIALSTGILPLTTTTIACALFAASGLWIVAASLFALLPEESGATDGGGNAWTVAFEQVGLLKKDPQLVRFIITRSLLTSTALSPPFLLTLSGASGQQSFAELGPLVIASAAASIGSTYFWGRLSDRSSRRVLTLAGLFASGALGGAAFLGWSGLASGPTQWLLPVVYFVVMVAHQGVRLGRSTHLVDMASSDTRAAYTALSNTIIGLVLVLGSGFGVLASMLGTPWILGIFACMAIGAAFAAQGLKEVQDT